MQNLTTPKPAPALPGLELLDLLAEIDDATEIGRYCGVCGHPEDSDPAYAKACCTDDNMIEE